MASKSDETDGGGKYAPWFRLFARDFLAQTGSMRAAEKGIYIVLLATMHDYGEPIDDDNRRLARRAGTTVKAFEDALSGFVQAGLIFRTDGKLWSPVSQQEFENITKKSKSAQKNARDGWEIRQQNQSAKNADAYRGQRLDSELDPDGPSDHQESSTSHASKDTNSKTGDRSAREGAASSDVNIEDEINLPEIGFGWVEKIISRRPLVTAVIVRDDEGCSTAYRVEHLHDEKLTWTEISLDDVDALPDRPDEREGTHDAA